VPLHDLLDNLDLDLKQVISTFGAGYQVAETQSTDISLLAGGRYLKMDADLKYDIGTGDSDLTWQALAGINYRFTRVHLTLGYAYMDWDFDKDSLLKDFTLSGPYAGIKFRF